MSIEVNDGGTWRYVKAVQINDNGVWRTTQNVQVNDNTTWRSPWILNTALTSGSVSSIRGYLHPSYSGATLGSAVPSATDTNGYGFELIWTNTDPARTEFYLYAPAGTFTKTSYATVIAKIGVAQLVFASAGTFVHQVSPADRFLWAWDDADSFGLANVGSTSQIHVLA